MKRHDSPGMEDVVETVREALSVLDENLIILSANRSFYNIYKFERPNQDIAQAKDSLNSLAVVITDINRFKPIWDIYRSEVRDRVLKEIADRLSASIRKGNTTAYFNLSILQNR